MPHVHLSLSYAARLGLDRRVRVCFDNLTAEAHANATSAFAAAIGTLRLTSAHQELQIGSGKWLML